MSEGEASASIQRSSAVGRDGHTRLRDCEEGQVKTVVCVQQLVYKQSYSAAFLFHDLDIGVGRCL